MNYKGFLLAATLAIILCISVSADVTVYQKSTMDNLMGMGGSEVTTTEYYKSDRSCRETGTKFTSGMMKFATGGKETKSMEIVRLDKSLIWDIEPKEKSYTERDFASMKEFMEKGFATEEMEEEKPPAEDEDEYIWTVDVKKSDKVENVNGFDSRNVTSTATGVNKKNQADTTIVKMKYWLSENVPGMQEVQNFQKNYALALGMDQMAMQQGMGQMYASYAGQFGKLAEAMKDVRGYPVRTIMEIEKTGMPKKETKLDESGEEKDNDEESIDENSSPTQIMGKLGKMMGKKAVKKDDKKVEKSNFMFSITTDVTKVESSAISDSKFEVPGGYKLKKEE